MSHHSTQAMGFAPLNPLFRHRHGQPLRMVRLGLFEGATNVRLLSISKANKRIEVSVGESVRILRELQEMSQNGLATATGIPQSTISAIENGRVRLGVDCAKVLAKALQCHPAVSPRLSLPPLGG